MFSIIREFTMILFSLKFIVLFKILFLSQIIIGQSEVKDYREYHKKINQAEEKLFLENDYNNGLLLFDSIFKDYDFVFVDDCIEAFQLALLYKKTDLALSFIKKAMDNGFTLDKLNGLKLGSLHNNFKDKRKKVTIHKDFVEKFKKDLIIYEKKAYANYLKRINKKLLQEVVRRHIKEQIYKSYIPSMGVKPNVYKNRYKEVLRSNLSFVYAHFKNNRFIGERNIGLVDNQLLKDLGINYLNENNRLDSLILKRYGLPNGTYVPVSGKELKAYFGATYLYIILFHNPNSYNALSKYKDEAIKKGYLHPREYASLKLENGTTLSHRVNTREMKLRNFFKKIENTEGVNKLREKYLIPKYEVDLKKHEMAQKYNLKLSFGFINGTR